MKIPPLNSATNGNASEPLPSAPSEILSKTTRAEPLSNPNDDNKQGDHVFYDPKLGSHPAFGFRSSSTSFDRSASHPTQSTDAEQPKHISDDIQPKTQKKISVQAQKGQPQVQSTSKKDILGFIVPVPPSEPRKSTLSSTGPDSGSVESWDATTRMSHFVIDRTFDADGPRVSHEILSNDLVKGLPIWDDHRPTKSDIHVKSRTDPVLLPQRTTNARVPPPKPTLLKRELDPLMIPEGWQEENFGLPHGRAGGW